MTERTARRNATFVGAATALLGGGLVYAPHAAAGALGLEDSGAVRIIGLADLTLVPGLVAGRPRWPWMAARAGLNLAIVAYLRGATRGTSDARPRAVALLLAAVTPVDCVAAWRLRAGDR